METIYESSRKTFFVFFKDDNGNLFVPTTARYRLDAADGTELIAWTPISPLTGRVTISIPATANRILSTANRREIKVFTVQSDQGTDNQLSKEERYQVTNLSGFTS